MVYHKYHGALEIVYWNIILETFSFLVEWSLSPRQGGVCSRRRGLSNRGERWGRREPRWRRPARWWPRRPGWASSRPAPTSPGQSRDPGLAGHSRTATIRGRVILPSRSVLLAGSHQEYKVVNTEGILQTSHRNTTAGLLRHHYPVLVY